MTTSRQVAVSEHPCTGTSYELTRFNALRHGVLSRYTVLPWESESEYQDLLHALADEHQPKGPTEVHLVEEMAGVLWRKRRLRQAEASALRRGLADTRNPYAGIVGASVAHLGISVSQTEAVVAEAIHATPEATRADLAGLAAAEAQANDALALLHKGGAKAYQEALACLPEDIREGWQNALVTRRMDREPYSADAKGLIRFLQEEVGPWYENRRRELEHRPLIQSQAFGEALKPNRLDELSRYEVHLDRKLERILAMLLKLQDMRRPSVPTLTDQDATCT
jgi:hypothetical protein